MKAKMEQLIILGSGIAGCTAAIYAARASLSPVVISGPEEGGQLVLTTKVENFPGFPEGILGSELVGRAKKQAERFGARFQVDAATGIKALKKGFEISLMAGGKIQCQALIIATGASAKWLGLKSEEKYRGRGVSVCATCDGAFFKGKKLIVVGGGDSAMEEAVFLTKFAGKVTVVHRRKEFKASKIMQERFFATKKTAVVWNSAVEEILGDGKKVTAVKLKNVETGKSSELECDGVFLAIGHAPNTGIFKGFLEMDDNGYIKTDRFMNSSVKGIFAAGDVQDTRIRQAITAAGSGCMAAMEAGRYLRENGN